MNPHSRRRIYVMAAPLGWLVILLIWIVQHSESAVIRWTYPALLAYLVVAWLGLWFRWAEVVLIERATFWALSVFFLGTMAVRLGTATDPGDAWRGLSPSVFMGLTILVVMGFLWFDTRAALRNAWLLPVGSTVIGLLYFVPNPGPEDSLLIDLIRYEMYLVVTTIFVYALARSKDALLASRVEADRMRAMAYRDPLTGLDNRRRALDVLERMAAAGEAAGVVLLDLDKFKGINDEHGHDVGDAVLREVAEVLSSVGAVVASRWGGEEFLLVVEGGADQGARTAERIRVGLESTAFTRDLRVTASFGVAALESQDRVAEVLKTADRLLYRAKEEGRNIVRVQPRSGRT